ncbi:peptidoglycan-binding protein [Kitasatospora indigofera]|uniref:COG1470 family protein n=1 Tax=Kitasatospora indigofera TaxID=67307 RepID=UPI00167EB4D0|nr:peptidoglycan-binding protein [Kitasatospora indigofera]
MSIWTSLEPASATVDAGGTTTVTLRVRNTGDVVEEYRVAPLGGPALWLRIEPAALTLYPGTTGTVELVFSPPRSPEAAAGPHPYALQVTPAEQRSATTVVEGVVSVAPFTELHAELVPPVSRGRFRGRFHLAVDNLGNTPVTAVLAGRDTGDQLDFDLHPSLVQIEPGRAVFSKVLVKPRRIRWSGGSETLPVTLAVQRAGAEPLTLEGSHLSRAVLPGWAAGLLGLLAAVLLGCLALWLTASPSVASRAKPAAPLAAQPAGAGAPIAPEPVPLAPEPTAPAPTVPGAPDPLPGQPAGSGGAGGSSGGGGGTATGGGGGGGTPAGGGGGGGAAPAPAVPPAPATPARAALPLKAGDKTPNLFVLFAQERLKRLDATNDCRLTKPVTAGQMDAPTVEKIACFQKATDDHKRTPPGTLLATDKSGNLGRATMSALWMWDVIGDGSKVGPGRTTWEVFATRAALRWADQSELSAADLAADEDNVRKLLASWSNKTALPTASYDDAKLAGAIQKYQTDQPAAAGSVSTALLALISGWVKDQAAPGVVQPTSWPKP